MYSANNQYDQNIAITFTGDDQLSEVVDKINEKINNTQIQMTVANLAIGQFNKLTSDSLPILTKLNSSLRVLDGAFQKTFNLLSLTKVFTQLHQGFQQATKLVEGFATGLKLIEVSGYSPKIIKDFQQLGSAISGDTEALEQFTFNAITAYNQFAKAKTEVAVLFNKDNDFVKNLSTNIQTLVNTDLKNAVSSIQALGAAYQAASAGFINAAENTSVMTVGLKLAKAGGADTGTVMKVLTQTIRAYGMQAQDASIVAAVLNKTVQLGITTMPELSNGFAQVAVTAKQAGIDIKELGAATAALTIKGFDTASAFTNLQSLFGVIISKTPEAIEALSDLRDEAGQPIKFDIAEIKKYGLAEEINKINIAAKGNQEIITKITGSITAYKAFLALAANNAQQLKSNNTDMLEVAKTGTIAKKALEEVFGIKVNNQSEKFEQIINRITEQFIQFGEQLAPFFDRGLEAVETFTKYLSSLSPETKKLIADFLIAQLTFNQVTSAIGALTGAATKAFITFQSWRLMNLIFTGDIWRQKEIITQLVVQHKNLGAGILQLIGIDQSHILLQKGINDIQLNRLQKVKLLKEENRGLISQVKQLIGIDQSHLLTIKNSVNETERRLSGLKLIVEQNKTYQKELKTLKDLEESYHHAQEKALALDKEINLNNKSIVDNKQKLKKAEIELKSAKSNGNEVDATKKYLEVSKELTVSEAVYNTNKIKAGKEQVEIQTALNKVNEQAVKVETISSGIKTRTLQVEEAQLIASEARINSDKIKAIASIAAIQAEEANTLALAANNLDVNLNTAAKLANEKATLLATEAKVAETAAENANTAAMKLKRNLYLEQEVAQKRLIEINRFGQKQYIANNLLTRIFFEDISKLAPKAQAAAKASGSAVGGIWDGLKAGAGAAIGFIGTKILPAIVNGVKNIALRMPELAAAVGVVVVAYDNWFGVAAKLRKLGEETNKAQQESYKNTIKELEERKKGGEKLTDDGEKYLLTLKSQKKEADGFHSTYEKVWALMTGKLEPSGNTIASGWQSIGKFIKDGWHFLNNWNPVINKLREGVGWIANKFKEGWDNFRTDQTIASFRAVNKQIEETQNLQIKAIKTTNDYKKGFTGDKEADALIAAGKSIDTNMLTRMDKAFQERKIELQGTIRTLEEQVKLFDKNLEGADLSKPDKLTTSQKLILEKKQVVEAVLENTKKIAEAQFNENKNTLIYISQREILLKRIQENNQELINGTKASDVGANALETRLRKSLRSSTEDLEQQATKITNTIKSSNKDLKSGVAELGATFINDFDQKVSVAVGNVDRLYENGYLTAKQAQIEYEKIMNMTVTDATGVQHKIVEILDSTQYLDIANRVNKTAKESSDYRLGILEKELSKTKGLQDAGVLSFIEGNKQLRATQNEQLKEQIKGVKENIEVLVKDKIGNKSILETLYKQLDVLNVQYIVKQKEDLTGEIEDRYKLQQESYDKELELRKISYEKGLITTKQYNQETNKLNLQENLNLQNKLKEEISVYKDSKKDVSELNKQLLGLQLQYEQTSKGGLLTSIEDNYRLQQKNYDKQIELLKLNYDKNLITTEDYNKELNKLTLNENLIQQNKLKEQLALYKGTKKDVSEINKQLLILQQQYEQSSKTASITQIEDNHRLRQQGYIKDLELTKINYEKGLVDTEQYNKNLDILNKKQNLDSQAKLREQLALYKNSKKDTFEIQKQILELQLQYQQINTATYEREFAKRSKIIENSSIKEKQSYQQLISNISYTITALEDEIKVRESRNKLLLINDQNDQSRLEFSLRTTGDLVKRAGIEEKISESKYKSLLIQQDIEKASLVNQQKSLELSFQKQQLELEVRKLENESNRKVLELELEKATTIKKASKEEIQSITLKLKANTEENRLTGLQEKTLTRQNGIQKEILSNSLVELNNKQQIAREGGLLDIQLSKENKILAGYQKQAERAKVDAQLTEIAGNKQIKQQEIISQLIAARVDNLNKQAQLQQISQDNIAHQYKLAQDLAGTDFQKQQLARAAAQQELNALNKKQEIEQKVLDMQIKSNQLAYQRQIIEQHVAEVKLKAEVKVQAAETAKVLANKLSTNEEKDAARAMLEAKKYELELQPLLKEVLSQKGEQLQLDEQVSKYDLNSKQRNERQDKLVNLANTSYLTSDKQKLNDAIKSALGNEPDQLSNQAKYTFDDKDGLRTLFRREVLPELNNNSNSLNNLPTLETLLKKPLNNNVNTIKENMINILDSKNQDYKNNKNKQPIAVTLNATNNINVTVPDGNNLNDLSTKIKDVTLESIWQVVKRTNIELQNGLTT